MSEKVIFLYKEQTYLLNGILFSVHNELGRFAREKQYADKVEEKFKEKGIGYLREKPIGNSGNIPDFIVWDLIILELKAKPFLCSDEIAQVQRYMHETQLKLGIPVNFRNKYLKPQRILNLKYL